MGYTLYVPLELESEDPPLFIEYPIVIWENLNDIIQFTYKKTFDKDYSELEWYLEPGAKDLVEGIEKSWFDNTLDTHSLYYEDQEFIGWLKDKYYTVALDAINEETDEYNYEISEATDYLISVYSDIVE